VLVVLASIWLAAAPADCPAVPENNASMPFAIDLAGRPGVPKGVSGQAYLDLPIAPTVACAGPETKPPSDVLRGEPGNLLKP
jgi:hypothetical protein